MRETLQTRLEACVERKRRDVFLRADFNDLGGYRQVGRALEQLVRDGKLIRLGQGVYTRTRPSLLDGKPTLVKGFRPLADEALRRLGIDTFPTRLEQDYSAGRTTQVPNGRVIAVRQRVRRRITFNGTSLSFERA